MRQKPWSIALCLTISCAVLGFPGERGLFGATPPSAAENEAFTAAAKQFEDKLYDLSEKGFAEFAARFPDSDRRPQAILYEAESLFFESKFDVAEKLLNLELSKAGDAADRYYFWLAEIASKRGRFAKAAELYFKVAKDFPKSELTTKAFYQQAMAMAKTGNWQGVVDALGTNNEVFAQSVLAKPDDEPVLRNRLLLAEAWLSVGKPEEASKVLDDVHRHKLSPGLSWRHQYLLCKLKIQDRQLSDALILTTNLTEIAASIGQQNLTAEAIVLQGSVLEQLNRPSEAGELYEKHLNILPTPVKRHAFLKVIDINLNNAQSNKFTNVTAGIEAFIQQNPKDDVSDLARLTLGEIRLKRAVEELSQNSASPLVLASGASNLLSLALTNFNQVIASPLTNDFVARGLLDKGWCFWFLGRAREAEAAFQNAADEFPTSADQATARFKLADSQFKLGEFAAAQTNYRAVLRETNSLGDHKPGWFDQALYQLLRSCLLQNDAAGAEAAVRDIMNHFPGAAFSDQDIFLFGQTLIQARKPEEARDLFSEFILRFPASPLRPDVELALAQTLMESGDYALALPRYTGWIAAHPGHPTLPQAVYSEALAAEKAGLTTNSFSMMTNFLGSFSGHTLAPLARKWVADYYFNHKDYPQAERNYQELYSNPTNTPKNLAYEARLMAGRAAYARQGVEEATTYFRQLFDLLQKDADAPPVLTAETSLLLGDTMLQQFLQSTNKTEEDLKQTIQVFRLATNAMPGSIYEARALGKIGDCHFQYSAWTEDRLKIDSNGYTNALVAYQAAAECPGADAAVRSQAYVKIGQALERQKLPDKALASYAKVLYQSQRGPTDAFWVVFAGNYAERIYEDRGQFEQAMNIYRRMGDLLPGLRAKLEARISVLQQKLPPEKL